MTEVPTDVCPFRASCHIDQKAAWDTQYKRNNNIDALFVRWGNRLDGFDMNINIIKTEMLRDRDYAKMLQKALLDSQASSAEYMASNSEILQELALSVKSSRDEAERNHLALLGAVTSNAMVAGNAVARADEAASRADHARSFIATAEGRVSTLTRAALAGWVLAIAAAGTLITHLIMDVGMPVIVRFFRGSP